jgi:phosphoglycerol transferase MdoB-like AlkP superfamily enzyme
LFVLLSFFLLVIVLFVRRFTDSDYLPLLTTKKNIRDLITNTRIGDVDNIDKFSFTDLLGGWIADVMIGVGLAFFTLSFSGCCGAW